MQRRLFGAIVMAVMACAGARTVPARPEREATLVRTLELANPAAGMCRDGTGLLLLEASGARMVRLSDSLVPVETIPLTERLAAPRGCAADRYYIYVYDDDHLYRMSRKDETLYVWLGNVRVAGLASYAQGEMLVSEASRGEILYKTVFGSSRRFVSASEIARPGAMAVAGPSTFAVLSAGERLSFLNQAGIESRRVPVPKGCDLLAAADTLECFVARSGEPAVWRIRPGGMDGWGLGAGSPTALVALPSGLAVLDAGNRVKEYRIEQGDGGGRRE
jgi:hypothetical protein